MFFIDLFADESEREQSIYILSTAQHPAASHKEIVEGIAKHSSFLWEKYDISLTNAE